MLGSAAALPRVGHGELGYLGCAHWAQLRLQFIIPHPAVSCVIPTSVSVAQVRSNLQAGSGALPDAELRQRRAVDAGLE